jgi:hypothetical protein
VYLYDEMFVCISNPFVAAYWSVKHIKTLFMNSYDALDFFCCLAYLLDHGRYY